MRTGTVAVVSDQPTATDAVAFPDLDDQQLAIVMQLGQRRTVSAGEVLFSPADDHYDWVVILSGSVDVLGPNGQLITQPRRPPLPRRGQPGHPPAAVPVDAWSPSRARSSSSPPTCSGHACSPTRCSATPCSRRSWPAAPRCCRPPPTPCRSSGPSTPRRRWRCASTPPATGSPTTGSTPTPMPTSPSCSTASASRRADLPIAITQRGLLKRATPGELAYQLGMTADALPDALLRPRRRRRRTVRARRLGLRRVGGPDAR